MRDTPSSETVTTLGAIAIELAPGSRIGRSALPQSEAGDWAAAIATDLARVVPGAAELDLVLVAALYDPAELLRPHFPRHAELDQLAARAPGEAGGRIIAFGAAANGLPPRLVPDAALGEGPLRVVPLLLRGSAAAVEAVGAEMEARLLDVGMANAATALECPLITDAVRCTRASQCASTSEVSTLATHTAAISAGTSMPRGT